VEPPDPEPPDEPPPAEPPDPEPPDEPPPVEPPEEPPVVPPDVPPDVDAGVVGPGAEEPDPATAPPGPELPPLPESFFDDEYRSEYQPPPLSWKLLRLIRRSKLLSSPHDGHFTGAGSEIFCITSRSWPHF